MQRKVLIHAKKLIYWQSLAAIFMALSLYCIATVAFAVTEPNQPQQFPELDPTKPPDLFDPNLLNSPEAANEQEELHLVLTAIFTNKDRKVAVINGVLLKEGETIAGNKVQEITESKVKVTKKKEMKEVVLELKLPNYSVKKKDVDG